MKLNYTQVLRTALPILLVSPALGQGASFTGLGFLSLDNPFSECTGVSDDGRIVCGNGRGPGVPGEGMGFLWTSASGMVPLGNPPLTFGSPGGTATDLSGDGWVVAGRTKFDGLNSAGFNWNPIDTFTPLAPAVATSSASASATNVDGSVTVGQTRHGGYVGFYSFEEATVWLDDGVIEGRAIGLFPGGGLSEARGVSADGSVVVGEAYRAYQEGVTAFRWDQTDGFVSLGDLPGGYHFSRANAANADGSIIVGYGTVSFNSAGFTVDHRACYWDEHGVHELPNMPGSTGITEATDISPDGRYIVGWARYLATNVPVIWDDVHGIRNLYEVMAQEGIDVSSWGLGFATAVSADGKTIVGHGRRGSPQTTEAWVCTLP
ncbi:MAG: putative HAF family extracellular repeat protein [Candidatus Paceibacteria bacterium]|jgi:probable HAF family extracellular repeat protein